MVEVLTRVLKSFQFNKLTIPSPRSRGTGRGSGSTGGTASVSPSTTSTQASGTFNYSQTQLKYHHTTIFASDELKKICLNSINLTYFSKTVVGKADGD